MCPLALFVVKLVLSSVLNAETDLGCLELGPVASSAKGGKQDCLRVEQKGLIEPRQV